MGSVVRVRELAFSLEQLGVEIYILTPYERSFDLSPKVHVVSTSGFLNLAGLSKTVYKLTKFAYYSKSFPTLFSKGDLQSNSILSWIIKGMAKLVREKDVDVVQVEQDVALPLGVGLKKLTELPLVVDVHNVSSEELVAAGIMQRGSKEFVALQERTKRLLGEMDRVVVVSECMQDYVVENYGLKFRNVCVVPPGGRRSVDKAVVERRVKPVKIAYAGLVAFRERVDLFVRSMPFVRKQEEDAEFFITDKGEAVGKIRKLASGLGVSPSFFWYDDHDEANRFLSSCHIGVLPSSDDMARKMGTPAKLFNYMSVGLPVVANDVGGWSEIIQKERVGVVTSDDPEDFGEALASVAGDAEAMREYAFNGLDLVESRYSWDASARVLLDAYDGLMGRN